MLSAGTVLRSVPQCSPAWGKRLARATAGFELPLVSSRELLQRRADIDGKPCRSALAFRALKDIARQRVLKLPLIRRGQGGEIGRLASVKGFGKAPHSLRHSKVADAHFTQVVVEIAAEFVEQLLSDHARGAVVLPEPGKDQHEMKHDQVKAALDGVGYTVTAIERGRARLRHDHAIEVTDVAVGGDWSKQLQDHTVDPGLLNAASRSVGAARKRPICQCRALGVRHTAVGRKFGTG